MNRYIRVLVALLLFSICAAAQKAQPASVGNDVRAMLQKSANDWNRGDLDAFATSYKNSPDILFIGKSIRRGYAQMLAGYKSGYPTREKMGVLTFRDLEVQPLDAKFATATGRFHLERTVPGEATPMDTFCWSSKTLVVDGRSFAMTRRR